MHKALIVKELRESAGIVILALLGVGYSLAELTATPLFPWQNPYLYYYPFVQNLLFEYFWLVAGGLAIALGFRQTAWELGQGTYFFLLHRPVSRRVIFGYKLLVGCGLLMLLSGLLVTAYAWWASRPGSFQAPFFWSMTIPAWQMWLAVPPLYFGAFLSGIRPARWYGSRLVPLITGILTSMAAASAPWVWSTVALSLIVSALMVVSILYYVQQRDY